MCKKFFFTAISTLLMLVGCEHAQQNDSMILTGKTMGSTWRVNLHGVTSQRASELKTLIQQQLDRDDQTLSTWKQDSQLSRFNQSQSTKPWPVDEGMADIVTQSLRIGRLTAGAMDITVGPLVNLWGFGPERQPQQTPKPVQIEQAKARTGLHHLRVIQDVQGAWLQKDIPTLYVDLSTVGEGYAVDHLARLLKEEGVDRFLISVGGTVIGGSSKDRNKVWRVAISKPDEHADGFQARVDLHGFGISTAGSYYNYYNLDNKRISHIIDPSTGEPIKHELVSVSVIAPTALEADCWDTGLMVMGMERAKALALQQRLAVYLMARKNGRLVRWMSPEFKKFLIDEQETPAE